MTTPFPDLLSPYRLGGLTLRNRVVSTGHAPGYADRGLPGERYQAYYEEKARGGLGLAICGGSSNISRESGSVYGQLYVGSDEIIAPFRAFAERMHRHDTALMCQITHMGRRTSWSGGDWMPTMAPSVIRDPAHHSVPYEMSQRDIARVAASFAAAALRCREGGLDGIELLATTHLLGQFLSPLSNRRADIYGGSLENRARMIFEVIERVRAAVGPGFVIGLRYAADESNADGLSAEEGIAFARMLGAHGGVDFVNVNGAYGGTTLGMAENFPGMASPAAPYVALARRVREASGLPTMQAARLSDPSTADWAIRSGALDLAGMTRPLIADPHLVAKLQAGDEARIRPCVGASYCIDRTYSGQDALCLHNVSTSRERTLPHAIPPAATQRRVVVIGGGPAGLEAARVSALRGHRVTLHEAAAELGGQTLLAARAGWRREIGAVGAWLAMEVATLGVEIRTNSFIDGPELLDAAPDVVIVATGGIPDTGLDATQAALAVSSWDLLSGSVAPASEVLVYDEGGSHAGASVADWLSGQGVAVELVTPDRMVARAMGGSNYPLYLRNLHSRGVRITPDTALTGIERAGNGVKALLSNVYARDSFERVARQIVVERNTLPADAPFLALRAQSRNLGEYDVEALLEAAAQDHMPNPDGTFDLYRIGDAVAGRDIHAAILDANRLCRTL